MSMPTNRLPCGHDRQFGDDAGVCALCQCVANSQAPVCDHTALVEAAVAVIRHWGLVAGSQAQLTRLAALSPMSLLVERLAQAVAATGQEAARDG